MEILLLPLMGPWHLHYPRYNAVSVLELADWAEPEALLSTALAPGAFHDPAWQDTPEVALPLTLVPWARRRGLAVEGVLEPSPDPAAAADFRRYAEAYPELRDPWQRAEAQLEPLETLLAEPLTLPRIEAEVLPRLSAHQRAREAAFGDGPASDWLRQRAVVMAKRVLAQPARRVVLAASAEHLPFLREALAGRADWLAAPELPPSPASRERSLLDYAFRGESADPEALLGQLRGVAGAEARYHEANLLLAHQHPAEALEVLEAASRDDFSRPYYLPGFLLARLGQLYDLAGDRDAARRAYRGALALAYAPAAARASARQGLEAPFALPDA